MKSKTIDFPSIKTVFSDPRMLLAFGLGSGLSRIMPGTMGSLAAIPLFLLLAKLPMPLLLAAIFLSALLGNYLCGYAAKKLGVHDHGGVVWDEFVGMWITLIAVPLTIKWIVVAFVFFRIFDMLKPWPISLLDKHVHGGFGIMIDDVAAGFAALACVHAAMYFGF